MKYLALFLSDSPLLLCFVGQTPPLLLCYSAFSISLLGPHESTRPFRLSFELLEVFVWGWMVYLEVLCIMYERCLCYNFFIVLLSRVVEPSETTVGRLARPSLTLGGQLSRIKLSYTSWMQIRESANREINGTPIFLTVSKIAVTTIH